MKMVRHHALVSPSEMLTDSVGDLVLMASAEIQHFPPENRPLGADGQRESSRPCIIVRIVTAFSPFPSASDLPQTWPCHREKPKIRFSRTALLNARRQE